MHEIRLVGRGGQGVVTAGELLGKAALDSGRQAQSIPTFGPERRGALSLSMLRIDDEPILLKCTTASPDVLITLDRTIWHFANVLMGLRRGATLIFNSPRPPEEIKGDLSEGRFGYRPPHEDYDVVSVDATSIALRTIGKPITNTAMMGALVGATGILGLDAVNDVLEQRFGARAKANIEAAEAAHDGLRRLER